MRRALTSISLAALALLASAGWAQSSDGSWVPTNDEIREVLEQRVGDDADRIGIVVGVIEPAGRRFVAHGSTGGASSAAVDEHTVFEIGSITKVFTALLLADMVERGEVALDDPIADYLPERVAVPVGGGRQITLIDLATHTSGLPRLPTNLAPADAANPYVDYSVEQLYEFLSSYELPRDVGAEFEYSNLGMGLLGHVLGVAAGDDYEMLVHTRITEPLGMDSTAVALTADLEARLATGHDTRRDAVSNWDLPTLAGAGALRSTASDMLDFLALHLGSEESALTPAAQAMHAVTRPAGELGRIALGWLIAPRGETDLVWHDGGTGGYRAFTGYDPQARVGVVVLTNISTAVGVQDIGRHLLDTAVPVVPPDSPLLAPPQERSEIRLAPELLETYTGRYDVAPGIVITITRDGDQLSAQLTGQPAAEIYPESGREFFYKVVDAQITFETGDDGRASALILHQGGRDLHAERLE